MKIIVSTIVPAPIHEVWRSYTTPGDIKQWILLKNSIQKRGR